MSFSSRPGKGLGGRLASLESHLKAEHPALLDVVPTYRQMDKILYRLGLLTREESLATRIPWWPLITVLGTFSSGKSTFINHFLGQKLQNTGNQAVDDKFTVVCYGPERETRTLPGTALDADPRFPFFGMSAEIDKVAPGEGKRIDAYLQLKTSFSDVVRGRIVIDSPGFDADDQRRSTLRLTNHIIDLSDLVLIFFDARHPEPGAMQDTLQHLVKTTVNRPDSGKFLYILNQIDTTAREDNPEEVVAAWQRAIAQAGLASGRFYCIYNEAASVPIEDAALRERFRFKRDRDVAEIYNRIREVEVERSYRIVSVLEMVASELEQEVIPALNETLAAWRRRVVLGDMGLLVLTGGLVVALLAGGQLETIVEALRGNTAAAVAAGVVFSGAVLGLHYWLRAVFARSVAAKVPEVFGQVELNPRQAFLRNTQFFRGVFRDVPVGWGKATQRKLQEIRNTAAEHIQKLNDMFTDPSGRRAAPTEAPVSAPVAPEEEPTES